MAPIARELADTYCVLEPLQTARSVEGHLADLDTFMLEMSEPVPLVGSSWGAMLALCYAAARPAKVAKLVLIGCGTFDRAARAEFRRVVGERMTQDLRAQLEDADLATAGDLVFPLYTFDPLTTDLEITEIDEVGHYKSWSDMIHLQDDGTYPAAFEAIEAPAVMLHGDHDPHPGRMIYESLKPHVRDLQYHEFAKCGHYPWIERQAREDFFEALRNSLR